MDETKDAHDDWKDRNEGLKVFESQIQDDEVVDILMSLGYQCESKIRFKIE